MYVKFSSAQRALDVGPPTVEEQKIILEVSRGNWDKVEGLLDEWMSEHPERIHKIISFLKMHPGLWLRYAHLSDLLSRPEAQPNPTQIGKKVDQSNTLPAYDDKIDQENKDIDYMQRSSRETERTPLLRPYADGKNDYNQKEENLGSQNDLRKRKRY